MAPLRLILALLVGSLGQKDAGTCPNDQDALMQIRASAMTNETDTGEMCENLVQPVYSSVTVGGGPFAVAEGGGQGPRDPPEKFTMCGRAEGRAGSPQNTQPSFCLCNFRNFAGNQNPNAFQAYVKGQSNEFPTQVGNKDWAIITPAQPASSAERCFRSGPLDPDIVTPPGYNFSCADPTGKTDRDPHRSCIFNAALFPARRVQEVPPNTQIVGVCVQEVDNPSRNPQVRTHDSTCRMIETPARCSSSVSTFELPDFTTRTFSFLLKCCDPNADDMVGQGLGDPHIHSLRGAHYTLLSQGNFIAWSYSKHTGGFEAKLFASYAGPRFTTQALALKTTGTTEPEMLEITAEDCQWRARSSDSGAWPAAESKDFSQSMLEVPPPTKGQGRLYMRASIILKTSLDPVHKLAKLMTRCKPGDHIDFKVEMFHKDDLDYVGGQLGAAPADQKTVLLSSGRTRFKTDAQFEAGEWVSLGGSGEAARFLKAKTTETPRHASLLSTAPSCSKSETEVARSICQTHFGPQETLEADLFADCIFDVCSGGGEEAAASIADLLTA